MQTRIAAATVFNKRKVSPGGNTLDKKRIGRNNLVIMVAASWKQINDSLRKGAGERDTFTKPELDQIERDFDELVAKAEAEVFSGD